MRVVLVAGVLLSSSVGRGQDAASACDAWQPCGQPAEPEALKTVPTKGHRWWFEDELNLIRPEDLEVKPEEPDSAAKNWVVTISGPHYSSPETIDKPIIRQYLRLRRRDVRRCYQRRLAVDRHLAGSVTTNIRIAPDGAVASVEIDEGIDPELDACVASVLLSARFPPAEPRATESLLVRYPIRFRPRSRVEM